MDYTDWKEYQAYLQAHQKPTERQLFFFCHCGNSFTNFLTFVRHAETCNSSETSKTSERWTEELH